MSRPSTARKLAISLAMPFALLGTLELALFLADFSHRPAEAPILIWNPVQGGALEEQGMLHADPVSLWSNRPRAEIPWGEAERVNDAGFRGPELPLERTPEVLRVAMLGDSSTFGFGVPYESCYSAQLERLLAEVGLAAEVLNAGVIGFTITQGLEHYRHLVRPYRPDVVVAAFSAVNEHHAAIESDQRKIEYSRRRLAAREEGRGSTPERMRSSQLAAWVAYALRGGLEGEREQFMRLQRRTVRSLATVGHVDWPETRRVSVEQFRELTRTLAREVEADGATLILVAMTHRPHVDAQVPVLALYAQALREIAASENVPLCDVQRAFGGTGAQGDEESPLFLDRWHPSAEGHALIARALVRPVEAAMAARADPRSPPRRDRWSQGPFHGL